MGIVEQIKKNSENELEKAIEYLPPLKLIAAIGATHDLGHPPFGHGGEVALNYCMRKSGGFEGNAQTLRILTKLEKFSENAGANLSRRTLLGCLKYPNKFSMLKNTNCEPSELKGSNFIELIDRESCKPPKCYFDEEENTVDWLLKELTDEDKKKFKSINDDDNEKHFKTIHQSFDCSIMNLADDISYGVHDFEDAVALGLISKETIERYIAKTSLSDFMNDLNQRYPKEEINYKALFDNFLGSNRKRYIGRLIHYFLTNITVRDKEFEEPLLKYNATLNENAQPLLDALKKIVRKEVIFSPNVQQLEFKGQRMVIEVFETLNSEPCKFLPRDFKHYLDNNEQERVICDYIAGMTDGYLLKTYERLCSPRTGSVFDYI